MLLAAADMANGPSYEILIAGDLADGGTAELLAAARTPFLPSKVLLHRPLEAEAPIGSIAPWTEARSPSKENRRRTCAGTGSCDLPVHEASELSAKLVAREGDR